MRALLLLCALCVTTSLQAAEINADASAESICPDRVADGDSGTDLALGGTSDAVPAAARPPVGPSSSAPERSRMSTRWHSLLPGMFR